MSHVKLVGQNSGTYYEIQSTTSSEIKVNDSSANSSLSTIAGDTTSIDTKLPSALGQTTKANSLAVTVASDDTLNVSDSTSQSTLSTISGKLPSALGQTTKANSLAVTIASGDTVAVSDSTSQSTLSTISGKLPSALGQTTKASSLSVTVASDDTVNVLSTPNKDNTASTLWNAQTIANSANATTSTITMTSHSRVQVYGITDNTTDTTIYMELSDDNLNWYRYSEKVTLVDTTNGYFGATFTDICVDYIRFYKANASGSSETITLKVTIMK